MENSVVLFTNLPDLTRCSIWILDGDLYHKGLLKFAVTAESLKDSLAVLVVDMSRPWTIMESLQKWTSVLREHVDKLKIAPGEMKEMEQSSKRCFLFLLLGCSRTNILVLTCTGNSDSSVIVGESMYMKSTLLLDLLFDFRVHINPCQADGDMYVDTAHCFFCKFSKMLSAVRIVPLVGFDHM